MALIIMEGPLTVTPALTYVKKAFNETDGQGFIIEPPLGPDVVIPLPVTLHGTPGAADPADAFIVSEATDLGALFTQCQINQWTELKRAIEGGLLVATVAGTIPICSTCD